MRRRGFLCSMSFNRFVFLLCGVYLTMVLLFHSRLQIDQIRNLSFSRETNIAGEVPTKQLWINNASMSIDNMKGWVHYYYNVKNLARGISRLEKSVDELKAGFIIESTQAAQRRKPPQPMHDQSCFSQADDVKYNHFRKLEKDVYVYSAFFDDRKQDQFIRMIMLIHKDKKNLLSVFCHFNNTASPVKAVKYEMCENHNKQYGGYFYSCLLPNMTALCPVSVSTSPSSMGVTIPLISVVPRTDQQQFGICIPPLFGNVKKELLVEFIELSNLLGAQRLFFYDYNLSSDMKTILQFYEHRNLTTVIPWKLPESVADKMIWYHGQLLAHNDCMYRSMSMLTFMAINDIDEFIIPHTKAKTWQEIFPSLLGNDYCGLAFPSAFFDPSQGNNHPSGLMTMRHTTRSASYSKVRTKVMVSPRRVFEVGIHHISKQNEEIWSVLKVIPEMAYLHHYRKCVSNYGMKCMQQEQDTEVHKYLPDLEINYNRALNHLGMSTQINGNSLKLYSNSTITT